jgi:hypothetical protein
MRYPTSVAVDLLHRDGSHVGYRVVVTKYPENGRVETVISEHPFPDSSILNWSVAKAAANAEAERIADAFGVQCFTTSRHTPGVTQ